VPVSKTFISLLAKSFIVGVEKIKPAVFSLLDHRCTFPEDLRISFSA